MSAVLNHPADAIEDERNAVLDALELDENARVTDIKRQFIQYTGGQPTADMADVIAAICNPLNEVLFIRAIKMSLGNSSGVGLFHYMMQQAIYYVANEAITKESQQ